jgi:phosphatidylserine synthase
MEAGHSVAHRAVSDLLCSFQVAAVDSGALRLSSPDYENALIACAARLAACDYIVTRDPRDFRGLPVPVLTPVAFTVLVDANPWR